MITSESLALGASIQEIDVPRLLTDLGITETHLEAINSLGIPDDINVASKSPIKTMSTDSGLRIVHPSRIFNVQGGEAPSGVNEQPFGQQTIDGARNRLLNLIATTEEGIDADSGEVRASVSLENGLFRVGVHSSNPDLAADQNDKLLQFAEGADLSTEYEFSADYEDRAVVAIRIPGYPLIVQISPASEAIRFPRDALLAAAQAEGGFARNTPGSMLVAMGHVADKQNPHKELSRNRVGGPLSRQDQMARVIIRGLLRLTTIPKN